jgi:hypothetical protein
MCSVPVSCGSMLRSIREPNLESRKRQLFIHGEEQPKSWTSRSRLSEDLITVWGIINLSTRWEMWSKVTGRDDGVSWSSLWPATWEFHDRPKAANLESKIRKISFRINQNHSPMDLIDTKPVATRFEVCEESGPLARLAPSLSLNTRYRFSAGCLQIRKLEARLFNSW